MSALVASRGGVAPPRAPPRPRPLHPTANRCRWLAAPVVAQLLERHAGNLDVDVNAVQQRARQPLLIAADERRAAGALLLGVARITTRPGILAVSHTTWSAR